MKRGMIILGCLLTVGTILTGTGFAQVVRVGDVGANQDSVFYLGIEKGYFKEKGIEIKLERFASAALMMAPLSTGELQVGGGGVGPALFNGFARGMPISIVAARYRALTGNSSDGLMLRADLKDQVRKFADLKGRKVALNAAASPLVYTLGKMMESEGLSLKDLEIVYMPWPDMGPAFSRKAIDAGAIVEPFFVQFEDKGYALSFKRTGDVIKDPHQEIGVIFYNTDWAKKNPKLARDLMTVYLRGARAYYEATQGDARARAELTDILIKYTPVKDKSLYERMQWGHMDPNGFVSKESLRDQQDWYNKLGTVPNKVDIDQVVDDSYVKYAVEQLGPYTPRRPGR